jgi:hypothetical protein
MRGARLFILATTLACAGCSASTAPRVAEVPPSPLVSEKPDFRLDFPEITPAADAPLGGALHREADGSETPSVAPVKPAVTAGVVQTKVEVPPKRETSIDDVLKLQKELVARNPASDDEKLRLALLHATTGNLEEAERIVSTVRSRTSKLLPYVEFYLRRQLGDHKEAGKLLAQFDVEERLVTGFVIERAELVTRVRRFRDYTPAENDRVAPGGDVHLYVEPRNFTLQRSGEKQTFHLKYEWKLVDDRAVEQPVPAWEKATVSEREDRITSNGPVAEFYQSFHLPLPANLATGHYRVKVVVTDALSGKSDRVQVPIYVMPVEKPR